MVQVDNEDSSECLNTRCQKKFESFDDVLPYIGEFGKYQWTLLLIFLPFNIAFITVFFGQIFITAVPQKHWCRVNDLMHLNLTQEQRLELISPKLSQYPYYDRCHYKKLNLPINVSEKLQDNLNLSKWETGEIIKCNQWEYDFSEIRYSTIGTELNWVCDQEYLIAAAQSIFYIGSIFGNFIFGWISDRFGRIKSLLCCTVFPFFASIGTANSHNFWTFAASRFFLGFAYDSIITIPLIIVLEYSAPWRRTFIDSIGFGISFGIAVFVLTCVSYFASNWRFLAYANSLPFMVCFLLTFIMPESIRWFMSKGKIDQIKKSLRRISKVNGKNIESKIIDQFCSSISHLKGAVENVSLLDLRKTPALAKNALLLAIVFGISSLILDVNIYYLNRYKMSLFLSFTSLGTEAIFASLLMKITSDRWGRRFSGCLGLSLITVFSYTFVLVKSETIKIVMGSLNRLLMSTVQILYCLYIPEFFPTTLRTQGAAFVHFFSVVMHFVAPYIVVLGSTWRELPIIITATLALLNSILILLLPETSGKNLRQTLQEGEQFCREKKFWPIFILQKSS